jgi:hypothetical protein
VANDAITFFTAVNAHVASCGEPPTVAVPSDGCYYGYFANHHGEQSVFVGTTDRTVVYCGDAGWEEPFEVRDGAAVGLVTNAEEALWIRACWEACRRVVR